jgi:hypothetical protein
MENQKPNLNLSEVFFKQAVILALEEFKRDYPHLFDDLITKANQPADEKNNPKGK